MSGGEGAQDVCGREPGKVAVVAVGGGLAVVAAPVVLSAVGFTATGITASSLAAKMMSVTAIANGGGVPAGSLVATLQSVGRYPGGCCGGRGGRVGESHPCRWG
ncbi:Interferon alpha-inducible protein 27, mitochondrial [Fukomys damarensis]|uniref:Interferon alpha-inducible protein 27, mitochondrial n=1 Tax=Fukomys damarensis TaxID=885580 RepID=A0A091CSR3_FUKDA|nr:Interferon alpha-inducible protein 27, mitochondrial [Fukomys damarensis]